MTPDHRDSGLLPRFGLIWPPLLAFAGLLVTWQAAATLTGTPTVIAPSPLDVAAAAADAAPLLLGAGLTTATTAVLGLCAGVVAGLCIAFAMTASATAASAFYPYLVALRVAPLVAFAPLVFLWFGNETATRAAMVATLTTFPVAVASLDGLRSTPAAYLDLAESVGAPAHRIFLRVRVPAAAPSVLAGVKLAAAVSVTGTVVVEFLTLRGGLGTRVVRASTALDTAGMFAALFALACLGLAFYAVPAAVENVVTRNANG